VGRIVGLIAGFAGVVVLLGIVLLGEIVDSRQLAGMAAICIGIAAIDGRAARFIARTRRR
jgi:drug/metabolite transporter (DMT)-like permease